MAGLFILLKVPLKEKLFLFCRRPVLYHFATTVAALVIKPGGELGSRVTGDKVCLLRPFLAEVPRLGSD